MSNDHWGECLVEMASKLPAAAYVLHGTAAAGGGHISRSLTNDADTHGNSTYLCIHWLSGQC